MPSDTRAPSTTHARVVIVGGGNAGLSVAGRLRREGVDDVAVIEPRGEHVYKPLLSHVAGGVARASETVRSQASVTPRGVRWVRDRVTRLHADERAVDLASGMRMTYDHIVVCPGIAQDWDAVPGLADAMRSPAGASNFTYELAGKASALLRDTTGGTVVFAQAPQPSTCAGVAQKPMYLACDYWRRAGVLPDIRVVLLVPEPALFAIATIDEELQRKVAEYGIEVRYDAEMTAVDAESRTVAVHWAGADDEIAYDVLLAAPPQAASGWIAESGLAGADGFVEVDARTLRSSRFDTVWSLGDAASTGAYRSGGALRKQTLVLAKNLVAAISGKDAAPERYDGYSVCPITVSRSTVVSAEFDRRGRLRPSIPFWKNMAREHRLTWVLDRRILPWVYWHMILKGRA